MFSFAECTIDYGPLLEHRQEYPGSWWWGPERGGRCAGRTSANLPRSSATRSGVMSAGSKDDFHWANQVSRYYIRICYFFCNGFGTIFLFNANKGRNQNLTVPSSILIRPKEKIQKKVIFLIDEEFTEGYFVDFFLRQFWMVSKNWKLKYEIF